MNSPDEIYDKVYQPWININSRDSGHLGDIGYWGGYSMWYGFPMYYSVFKTENLRCGKIKSLHVSHS